MSETVRETVLPPGEVKRITVAVMVDGVRSVGDDGSPIWTPRPQQELDAIFHAGVAGAGAGFLELLGGEGQAGDTAAILLRTPDREAAPARAASYRTDPPGAPDPANPFPQEPSGGRGRPEGPRRTGPHGTPPRSL